MKSQNFAQSNPKFCLLMSSSTNKCPIKLLQRFLNPKNVKVFLIDCVKRKLMSVCSLPAISLQSACRPDELTSSQIPIGVLKIELNRLVGNIMYFNI